MTEFCYEEIAKLQDYMRVVEDYSHISVDIEATKSSLSIQDIINQDLSNELGREELVAALVEVGLDGDLAYESKEGRLSKLKGLL